MKMMKNNLKKIWKILFANAPKTLASVKEVNSVATAFNANIDAVLKIDTNKFSDLLIQENLSLSELRNIKYTKLDNPQDVLKGIFKSFSLGIAEEWLTADKNIYDWMVKNLGYDKLQMGGQGGIVANVLGIAGVKKVFAHCNSLPQLQADQFLELDNICSFDESGCENSAYKINRNHDVPLIHWIIEFNKGDKIIIEGQEFVCPKSNRFIATYDPLNLNLVIDKNFVETMTKTNLDYIILSGFHALSSENNGVKLLENSIPFIKQIKKKALLHLEIASTQDLKIRENIINQISPLADSIGVNERETIDVLEILGLKDLQQKCEENCHSINLFNALIAIKKKLKIPRIQLHFFGMYLTIQDKNFKISAQANRNGMILAAIISTSKAGTGSLNEYENLLWSLKEEVSDIGLKELEDLSAYIKNDALLSSGICQFEDFDIIAIPTILIEKPKTLVGMGDTISSISLVSAR